MIKIYLKQREYTFLWRFRSMTSQWWLVNMLLTWKETMTDREIGYAKYGEYGLYAHRLSLLTSGWANYKL